MLDHDATHEPAQVNRLLMQPYELAPAPPEDKPTAQTGNSTLGTHGVPLTGFGTALFLLGMALLGASSAAIVFHDRLFRILGW